MGNDVNNLIKKDVKKSKKQIINEIKVSFPARSMNEGLSRMIISALVCQLDPTVDDLCDIKTAVSEAVTNCIVHAYKNKGGIIKFYACYYEDAMLYISIKDNGCGIDNIKKAMEPLYTTDSSGERSGMGFSIMQNFMDRIIVKSAPGKGTTVNFYKKLKNNSFT